ncbi:MAG: ABC transporter substrate-binding protein, partial [Myxococcota bacterium]
MPEPIVLRVSASHGLPSSHNGSMAYAHDLTYLLPYEYKLQRRGERSVALRPLQPPEEIAQYCQKLCIERSTRIVREGATCIIEFETTRSRDEFADSEFLPVGPFRLHRPLSSDAETATQTIELIDECDRTAIDVIRIQATTTAAEWKELYAGEVDVVPMTSIAHLQRFERMGTIKTKILPASNAISLFFNTERAPWSSPSVRRRIAAAIDTWAVADVVCRGYRSCSIEPRPIIIGNEALATAGPPLELPQELSVLVPSSDLEAIEAAKTTVFHLRTKLQVEIEVES